MDKIIIKVGGMSCEHCVRAVKEALESLEGVSAAQVDLTGGTAAVEYDAAVVGLDAMKAAIEQEDYEVL